MDRKGRAVPLRSEVTEGGFEERGMCVLEAREREMNGMDRLEGERKDREKEREKHMSEGKQRRRHGVSISQNLLVL